MTRSSEASVRNVIEGELQSPANMSEGAIDRAIMAAGGKQRDKSVQLTGNGASTENLFVITEAVEIFDIWFIATSVSDSTTFSNVKFELNDGTVSDDITAVVDASGIVAGGMVIRNNTSGNAAAFVNADQGRISDAPLSNIFAPFFAVAKNGAPTYIRLSYTGDASTDITIDAHIRYAPVTNTSDIDEA